MAENLKTIKGGIHPKIKTIVENFQLSKSAIPEKVVIPMSLHIGAPCTPIVKKGDHVLVGQKIGEANGFVSVPIHASISGDVLAVEALPHPNGTNVMSVVIQSDGKDEKVDGQSAILDYKKGTPKEIVERIREAGIVGLGGATFPTHVKLTIPEGKKVDCVILNGAECEPYLASDRYLMETQPDLVIEGLQMVMKATGAKKGFIGIENNKENAIKLLQQGTKNLAGIETVPLKTKYPQGAEKQLIHAITEKEVPSGGLPVDVGVVVVNVATSAQIAETLKTGMPLYKRILTCTGGAIEKPKVVEFRIGTILKDIVDQCGGFSEYPTKVIMGGPMMGIAQSRIDVPTIKGTSGILCLDEQEANFPAQSNCIRCGKCSTVCPMHLQPFLISAYASKADHEKAEKNHIMDCIECGSCAYVCPAKRTLVSSIRVEKKEITKKRKAG